jgi:tetratricopeptide (TPR) repeat protein
MNIRYMIFFPMVALLLTSCSGMMPEYSSKPSQNSGVLALLDQANHEISAGQYQKADVSLERALRIEPRNSVLWQKLAVVRLNQGEYQQAENLAIKSNVLDPDNRRLRAENWRIIGQARTALVDMDGAQAAFGMAQPGE